MTVASHLNIRLDEYDSRIRTFIPGYDAMLDAAARALQALDVSRPVVVDAGTGTGALALRCIHAVPGAEIIAVDEDADILALARQRLSDGRASFVQGSFLDLAWPPCGRRRRVNLTASRAHDRAKAATLPGDPRAIHANGLFISADCFPSSDDRLREIEFEGWRAHLRSSYSDAETDAFFAAWAEEDLYVPLLEELALMEACGIPPGRDLAPRADGGDCMRAIDLIGADGLGQSSSAP